MFVMMKHLTLLLVFLSCILSTSLFAQSKKENQQTFRATIIAGANAAQIDGDDLAGFNKLGIRAGAQVSVRWHRLFESSVGMLYSQKGSASELSASGTDLLARFSLNYVQIPLMVTYDDEGLQFGAGFSYSRLINSKIIIQGILDEARSDSYSKNDFSFVAQGGYFIKDRIGFHLGFERSLGNILKSDVEREVNRLVYLTASYRI